MESAGSNIIKIKVIDTGRGINSDFLPYIFDRFRQEDGSITRRYGGLGLGLALVRHLVELHGGAVEAKSDGEGKGATFVLTLPAGGTRVNQPQPSNDCAPLTTDDDEEDLPLEGVNLLVVDDDRDNLDMLAVGLERYGATIQVASSAAEALEVLQRYNPDVLVSDIAMPDEDGYGLIRRIRESNNATPAIALTAYVRMEDQASAISAGFNAFVPKPVELNELITAVKLALKGSVSSDRN